MFTISTDPALADRAFLRAALALLFVALLATVAHAELLGYTSFEEPDAYAGRYFDNGNPLEDLEALKRLEMVILNGDVVVDKR